MITFNDELYLIKYALITGDFASYQRILEQEGVDTTPVMDSDGFFVFDDASAKVFIYLKKKNKLVLMHEVNHAVISIFHFKGIPITPENSEAYCYYFDLIYKKLSQKL